MTADADWWNNNGTCGVMHDDFTILNRQRPSKWGGNFKKWMMPLEKKSEGLGFHDIVQSGKIRYICTNSIVLYLHEVAATNGWMKFVSMQNEYSLLYWEDVCPILSYLTSPVPNTNKYKNH